MGKIIKKTTYQTRYTFGNVFHLSAPPAVSEPCMLCAHLWRWLKYLSMEPQSVFMSFEASSCCHPLTALKHMYIYIYMYICIIISIYIYVCVCLKMRHPSWHWWFCLFRRCRGFPLPDLDHGWTFSILSVEDYCGLYLGDNPQLTQ